MSSGRVCRDQSWRRLFKMVELILAWRESLSILKNIFQRLVRKRGLLISDVVRDSGYSRGEVIRFCKSKRLYLDTSAFNYIYQEFTLEEIINTRDYQRNKNTIFVMSPILLWEIFLNSDREKCDSMLMTAQALFDPIILATPSELIVRYLEKAYPNNTINYTFFNHTEWSRIWRKMASDFSVTFDFSREDLLFKTEPYRVLSRNINSILMGRGRENSIISAAIEFIDVVYSSIKEDLILWKLDESYSKIVILFVFMFMIIYLDLDSSEVVQFWKNRGYGDKIEASQISSFFLNFPEIFFQGPFAEMARMISLQIEFGRINRGTLHDGMHMIYSPYVTAILSNDEMFLRLSEKVNFYRYRVVHLSNINFKRVKFP